MSMAIAIAGYGMGFIAADRRVTVEDMPARRKVTHYDTFRKLSRIPGGWAAGGGHAQVVADLLQILGRTGADLRVAQPGVESAGTYFTERYIAGGWPPDEIKSGFAVLNDAACGFYVLSEKGEVMVPMTTQGFIVLRPDGIGISRDDSYASLGNALKGASDLRSVLQAIVRFFAECYASCGQEGYLSPSVDIGVCLNGQSHFVQFDSLNPVIPRSPPALKRLLQNPPRVNSGHTSSTPGSHTNG